MIHTSTPPLPQRQAAPTWDVILLLASGMCMISPLNIRHRFSLWKVGPTQPPWPVPHTLTIPVRRNSESVKTCRNFVDPHALFFFFSLGENKISQRDIGRCWSVLITQTLTQKKYNLFCVSSPFQFMKHLQASSYLQVSQQAIEVEFITL